MNNEVEFINKIGGTTVVAAICGITKGAVSQWKKTGIPKAQLNFLKEKFPEKYREATADLSGNRENPNLFTLKTQSEHLQSSGFRTSSEIFRPKSETVSE